MGVQRNLSDYVVNWAKDKGLLDSTSKKSLNLHQFTNKGFEIGYERIYAHSHSEESTDYDMFNKELTTAEKVSQILPGMKSYRIELENGNLSLFELASIYKKLKKRECFSFDCFRKAFSTRDAHFKGKFRREASDWAIKNGLLAVRISEGKLTYNFTKHMRDIFSAFVAEKIVPPFEDPNNTKSHSVESLNDDLGKNSCLHGDILSSELEKVNSSLPTFQRIYQKCSHLNFISLKCLQESVFGWMENRKKLRLSKISSIGLKETKSL